MRSQAFGQSDTGRVRTNNEDSFLIDEELGLYIVCDGMGGHAAGEVASRIAVEEVARVVRERAPAAIEVKGGWSASALVAATREAIEAACRAVFEEAAASPERRGMGCTLTMLLCSGPKAVMGHVGDSRLYLLRDGEAHQLSSDHSLAAELVRQGALTPEEARDHHFSKIITRAIGRQPMVQPDILVFDTLPGDRYLLCSDGLSDYVKDEEELGPMLAEGPFEGLPARLLDFANQAGGRDNITAVVLRYANEAPREAIRAHVEAKRAHLEAVAAASIFDEDFMVHLVRVLHTADTRSYEPGEAVIAQGEHCAALYIPAEGELEVRDDLGNVRRVKPGDILAETSLFRPRKSRASVTALVPSRVLVLDADKMRAMMRRHPWFGIGVLERLGRHLSRRLDARGATMATVPDELSP